MIKPLTLTERLIGATPAPTTKPDRPDTKPKPPARPVRQPAPGPQKHPGTSPCPGRIPTGPCPMYE